MQSARPAPSSIGQAAAKIAVNALASPQAAPHDDPAVVGDDPDGATKPAKQAHSKPWPVVWAQYVLVVSHPFEPLSQGCSVGIAEGVSVGIAEGVAVGEVVGSAEGVSVGELVGPRVATGKTGAGAGAAAPDPEPEPEPMVIGAGL